MYKKDFSIDLEQYPTRMTSSETAEALGITLEALNSHLSRGTIVIPFVKIGKSREFLKTHVINYLEAQYLKACEAANAALEKVS